MAVDIEALTGIMAVVMAKVLAGMFFFADLIWAIFYYWKINELALLSCQHFK